jgi:alpha/beta superfamily hydrolase
MHVEFEGAAGRLEGLLETPGGARGDAVAARAAVVLAHAHPSQGGTMHTKAVFQAAKGLGRIGCAVLRFNFRGVGASFGIFDHGKGETEDFTTALDLMATRYPGTPLWTAGFSFGSWVALETGAADPRVSVLIGIAPPVARDDYSFPHTLETTKPKFFVQGDLDELCPLKDLMAFYAKLKEPKELAVVHGATHLFDGQTAEVGEALEDLLGDYQLDPKWGN